MTLEADPEKGLSSSTKVLDQALYAENSRLKQEAWGVHLKWHRQALHWMPVGASACGDSGLSQLLSSQARCHRQELRSQGIARTQTVVHEPRATYIGATLGRLGRAHTYGISKPAVTAGSRSSTPAKAALSRLDSAVAICRMCRPAAVHIPFRFHAGRVAKIRRAACSSISHAMCRSPAVAAGQMSECWKSCLAQL